MRIVVATCEVYYSGRGDTYLDKRTRMLLVKDDGSIMVHNNKGIKPLNYMTGLKTVHSVVQHEGHVEWLFETRRETLKILLYEILNDDEYVMDSGEDDKLLRDGTEDHLQEWLSLNPQVISPNVRFVEREHATGAGPVDLLYQYVDTGELLLVEVKRVAMIGAVDQIVRYVSAVRDALGDGGVDVVGCIAALDIRPNTVKQAERKGIRLITIPGSWRGDELNYRASTRGDSGKASDCEQPVLVSVDEGVSVSGG